MRHQQKNIMKAQENYMRHAMALAEKAEQLGEVPVGAIVVYQDKIIGEGYNRLITDHNATAHAEMMALEQAGKYLQNYRLINCELYVTLEPCPMCAAAMVHSRIKKVTYGTSDPKTGAAGSVMNLLNYEGVNHYVEIEGGVLADACKTQLQNFFKRRRAEKRAQREATRIMQKIVGTNED